MVSKSKEVVIETNYQAMKLTRKYHMQKHFKIVEGEDTIKNLQIQPPKWSH